MCHRDDWCRFNRDVHFAVVVSTTMNDARFQSCLQSIQPSAFARWFLTSWFRSTTPCLLFCNCSLLYLASYSSSLASSLRQHCTVLFYLVCCNLCEVIGGSIKTRWHQKAAVGAENVDRIELEIGGRNISSSSSSSSQEEIMETKIAARQFWYSMEADRLANYCSVEWPSFESRCNRKESSW